MSSVEHQGLLEVVPDPDSPDTSASLFSSSGDDNISVAPQRPGFPIPPPRTLTNLNGLALVIGLQIGSGIFAAPSVVITKVPSTPTAVSVWVLAGLLVWTGAASFIELATRVPQNGGIQEYLRHCYGDVYGFMFAWIWLLVSRPCAMGMVALVFSEYLFKAVFPDEEISVWMLKGTSLLAVALITFLNCLGTHVGTGAASFFLVLKIAGLGSIALIGLMYASGLLNSNRDSQSNVVGKQFTLTPVWAEIGNFTDAVLAALFAYGGWESISFVQGEIKDPQRTLPRILNLSMLIVITLFTLSNFTLYNILSLETLQGTNAVAIAFGEETLGRFGALFYAWVVCLACLGTLNSIVFSTGRLTQAAGARHYLPDFLQCHVGQRDEVAQDSIGSPSLFSRVFGLTSSGEAQNVPINAMALNAAVAAVYVMVGSFRGLLTFKGMVEYLVYFTTVLGLLLLPRTQDSDAAGRVCRTPIWNPVIFCGVVALIVVRSAITHLMQVLVIIVVLGAIFVVYRCRWWKKLASPADAAIVAE